MNELSASSSKAFILEQVSTVGEAAAIILTATILLGLGIWLVFLFLGWLRGAVS